MKKFWLNVGAFAATGFGATYQVTGSTKAASAAAAITAVANVVGLMQKPPQQKK